MTGEENKYPVVVIDSSDFAANEGLVAATLSQSTEGPSVLKLQWHGYGPDWLAYMQPVTLMHRGAVLFHGRITAVAQSNNAGVPEASAEVQDALWLLDDMSFSTAVVPGEAELEGTDLLSSSKLSMRSFSGLQQVCQTKAPLWVVSPEGVPLEDGELSLNYEGGNEFASTFNFKRIPSVWSVMMSVREANPNVFYLYEPTTGVINVLPIGRAERLVLDTEEAGILAVSDISAKFGGTLTGVAAVVSWPERFDLSKEEGRDPAGTLMAIYPEGASLSLNDAGVKVFTAVANNRLNAYVQLEYMKQQLGAYYTARNERQWSGGVSVLIDSLVTNPLGKKLCLTGKGLYVGWATMEALVSGAEWDFVAGTVELSLGFDYDLNDISMLEFEDEQEDEGSSSRSHEWGIAPGTRPSGRTNSRSGGSMDPDSRDSTSSGSDESEDDDSSESESEEPPSEPDEVTMTKGPMCDCEADRNALRAEIAKLQEQLAALEAKVAGIRSCECTDDGNRGECDCNCAEELMSAIEGAIAAQISTISLSATVSQEVETTMTGSLKAVGTVTVSGSAAMGSVRFTY